MARKKASVDHPHVHQINVSNGGVPKLPVSEALVTAKGLEGDRQRNLVVHGGPDRAVCLFSWERIQALQREGHSIAPGAGGENLTLAGLDWGELKPGDQIRLAERVLLELTGYTEPCKHNAQWFKEGNFNRMNQKRHPGWSRLYARVLAEGTVQTGDAVVVERIMGDG
ncbi:MAG: MOSC domain-containing protein [Nitrospira sp.]|nr:MAG: MOSC domain-containing protein [Nitrospira sp.]